MESLKQRCSVQTGQSLVIYRSMRNYEVSQAPKGLQSDGNAMMLLSSSSYPCEMQQVSDQHRREYSGAVSLASIHTFAHILPTCLNASQPSFQTHSGIITNAPIRFPWSRRSLLVIRRHTTCTTPPLLLKPIC